MGPCQSWALRLTVAFYFTHLVLKFYSFHTVEHLAHAEWCLHAESQMTVHTGSDRHTQRESEEMRGKKRSRVRAVNQHKVNLG